MVREQPKEGEEGSSAAAAASVFPASLVYRLHLENFLDSVVRSKGKRNTPRDIFQLAAQEAAREAKVRTDSIYSFSWLIALVV